MQEGVYQKEFGEFILSFVSAADNVIVGF